MIGTGGGSAAHVDLDLAGASRLEPSEVISRLGSADTGLTDAEATGRLERVGPNAVHVHRVTVLDVLLRQLRNPLLVLLLAAAVVSGITGDPTDAAIIGVIVALTVGLGVVNEFRAETAAASLHARIRHQTIVERQGGQRRLNVADLVPGDIVVLGVGDIVPADLRLIETNQLECDEAVLTGEAMAVSKVTRPSTGTSLADLDSCALMGTVVHEGSARAVVVATGPRTSFGQIAAGLSERPAVTAFERGLHDFSALLVRVAAVLCTGILVVNVALSRPLIDAVLFSLAIAVGITPAMMPAIVTASLSSGARRLAKRRVLVKRLVTIEDLGNIELLFTDKTGTLTEGAVRFDRALGAEGEPADAALVYGLLCNEATVTDAGVVGGNALDQALMVAPPSTTLVAAGALTGYERAGDLPFDHDRRLASVAMRTPKGKDLLITKGAPEAILARCTRRPDQAQPTLDRLFAEGYRVIAVATRSRNSPGPPTREDESDLTLAGFLTFVDPPKADAKDAIARLVRLAVGIKIITGDNAIVAAKVCADIGMPVGATISGTDLDRLDDDALAAAIPGCTVFARVTPDQKSRIIRVARRGGVDVAFLGDGVNDAVALHHADVGISVDSAADVAKDAADIVLLEKDLGVLADAVVEGRRIFANTVKYILMATSSNFGNMFSAAGASLFLSFLPMLPSQILLNNLLYDAGQLAIPTDSVDDEVLARPGGWDMRFLRRFMMVFGPVSSAFDFLTFGVLLWVLDAGPPEFRTGWFVESIATQTLVVYLIRTRRVPFYRSRPSRAMLTVPTTCAVIGAVIPLTPLSSLLGFTPLPLGFLLLLITMVIAYLVLVEVVKTRFYAALPAAHHGTPSPAERRIRRVRRRAFRFTHHL